MATAQELQVFLKKRGYSTSVMKEDDTYIIGIRSQTVEEVAKLLASVGEPGRYVVSVQLSDIIDFLVNTTHGEISNFSGNIATVRELVENTSNKLMLANSRTHDLHVLAIRNVTNLIDGLTNRIEKLENPKHWWKRGK